MDSKQIFVILAIAAALSTFMIDKPVMAQNMTGGNLTAENMTGGISSLEPPADFFGHMSGCPVDSEGIERCPPPQDLTESNGDTNENGNGDASVEETEDSSNDNGNGDSEDYLDCIL
jgi:hypothetical protein